MSTQHNQDSCKNFKHKTEHNREKEQDPRKAQTLTQDMLRTIVLFRIQYRICDS